eukprot:TRINITY_DN5648_c0_g1_i1.p1 TRINITY_DN5648_c0_g1~~TRINITY_DN5648_c0_g1_i1.p1  ORF type:complete len:283 (+),score=63.80 TRINITY_DN5648_c0_g1_i1:67-915(+)
MVMQLMRLLVAVVLAFQLSPCLAADQDDGTYDADIADEEQDAQFEHVDAEQPITPEQLYAIHSESDTDADGKMSFLELLDLFGRTRLQSASADIVANFDALDVDKDGQLSFEEFHPSFVEGDEYDDFELAKFQHADIDKDGFLTETELIPIFFLDTGTELPTLIANHSMNRYDQNGDSQMDKKEFYQLYGVSESGDAIGDADEYFIALDVDKSDALSVEELVAWESGLVFSQSSLQDAFSNADTDSDGHLTADEFQASREDLTIGNAYHLFVQMSRHMHTEL